MLPHVAAALKNGGHHAVRAFERFHAVGGGGDAGGIVSLLGDAFAGAVDRVQALGIHVHQRDVRVGQRREGKQVAHQRTGEAETAGSDKGDFTGHESTSLRIYDDETIVFDFFVEVNAYG